MCGRGTRVFEVRDKETGEVHVLKDCWIENRRREQTEHEIVTEIKEVVGPDNFCRYFVDTCGHRETDLSGGFQGICSIPDEGTFKALDKYKPQSFVLARFKSKPTHTQSAAGNSDPNQSCSSTEPPPPTRLTSEGPEVPHPLFRYQIVYCEKGMPLYEVTSLEEVFEYLGQIIDGMRRDPTNQNTYLHFNPGLHYLHEAGWIHRDLSPRNIIVVGGRQRY